MQIYLLRHGIAEDAAPGGNDADRALTTAGRKKLRDVLRLVQAVAVTPTLILSSPYRRALETAELAADILGYEQDLLKTKALTPSSTPEAVWEELRVHRDAESVLLAGHEPLFSRLTAYLLNAPQLAIDFKKGGLVRVDLEQFGSQPRGVLKWYIVPKLASAR
jgi:phosphohistidine phosphatase